MSDNKCPEKLISDLTNDLKPCCPCCPYGTSMKVAMIAIVFGLGLLVSLGLRHDLPVALGTFVPYWKSGMFALIGVGALLTVCRLGLPGRGMGVAGPALMIAGLTGLLSFMAGMMSSGSGHNMTEMTTENSRFCIVTCLGLGLAVFAAAAVILRRLAYMRPRLAGWLLGTASGALVTASYAWHCPHDQPLYVLWYATPVIVMGLFGALIGRRVFKM